MKRPAFVVVTAVLELLGSLITGLMAVSMVFAMMMAKNPAMPPETKYALPFALALFGGLTIWGITTAIGLFLLKNWARISTIVFSVFLAFAGFVTGPMILIMPQPPQAPPNFAALMKVMAVLYGAVGLLGAFWLYYFNRRATREVFRGGALAVESGGRPLSISIIGWWLLLTGIMMPLAVFFKMPAILLTWVITGWPAMTLNAIYGLLGLSIGYGLLKLKPEARIGAICWLSFGAVNSVIFYALPDRDARLASMMSGFSFGMQQPQVPAFHFSPLFMLPMALVTIAVPIWFLVKNQSAFEPAQPPA